MAIEQGMINGRSYKIASFIYCLEHDNALLMAYYQKRRVE
jgi:hypothetical protein